MLSLLIALTLSAADDTPAIDQPGFTLPERVRYELVYHTAKTVCPATLKLERKEDVSPFLDRVVERLGFNDNEAMLLSDFCLIWYDGRLSA